MGAGTRNLFVDDYNISEISGLVRSMNSPQKHGSNPLVFPDKPWEEGSVFAKNSVIFDHKDQKYKMWYRVHGTCYAESKDGLVWDKPNLGFAKYGDSYDNNIIGRDVFQIVSGKDDFKKLKEGNKYMSVNWSQEMGNYLITSPDGMKWDEGRKIDIQGAGDTFIVTKSTMALTGTDPGNLPGYPNGKDLPRYIGVVRWCKPVGRFDGSSIYRPTRRVQALVASNDMFHWEKPVRILTPDALDDEIAHERIEASLADGTLVNDILEDRRCEFYTILVFPYEEMYFGLLMVFYPSYDFNRIGKNNQAGPCEIQLVASRDLYNWTRVGERKPFIAKGGPGEFDQAMAFYLSAPIMVEDTMRFYYSGSVITHAGQRDEGYMESLQEKIKSGELPGMQCIGLATLRRDGFISLDAGNSAGYVLTKPFNWPEGKQLHINADASHGEVYVSACQPDGTPYIGHEASHIMKGDMVNAPVLWKDAVIKENNSLHTHGTNMEAPAEEEGTNYKLRSGNKVRLKIHAKNAKLYSYWFE